MRRKFERELSEVEVFLEAAFTTFTMTFTQEMFFSERENNLRAGYHLGPESNLLWITFYTSLITAGLGMGKSLKVGVCKILPEKGLLSGFLSLRFIFIFLYGHGAAAVSVLVSPQRGVKILPNARLIQTAGRCCRDEVASLMPAGTLASGAITRRKETLHEFAVASW